MSWIPTPVRSAVERVRNRVAEFFATPDDDDYAQPMGFVKAWLLSRDYRDLLLALPAVLGAMVLAVTAGIAMMPTEEASAKAYLQLASQAQEQGNSKLASMYVRKASRLSTVDSPTVKFRRGLALYDAGQHDEAITLISELAPENSRGL